MHLYNIDYLQRVPLINMPLINRFPLYQSPTMKVPDIKEICFSIY